MATRQFYTATDDLDALWDRVHRTRSTSKSVTVPIDLLKGLLMDHTRMTAAIQDADIPVRPAITD